MNYSEFDDATLIAQIARADSDAFGELYDRYSRLVFSLALNSVGDRAKAEEITQEVFVRVWENAETYQPEKAQVNTWLTTITRYRSIDELRRRGSRPEQRSLEWAHGAVDIASVGPNPEKAAEHAVRQQRIRAALAEIPPEQKKALAMAFFEGYTHREIAELLGHPLGTVKTRIRLAMQKLRRRLQDEQSNF